MIGDDCKDGATAVFRWQARIGGCYGLCVVHCTALSPIGGLPMGPLGGVESSRIFFLRIFEDFQLIFEYSRVFLSTRPPEGTPRGAPMWLKYT